MRKFTSLRFSVLILTLMPNIVCAISIGDAANNLMGPMAIVTKFLLLSCYVIGLVLVMVSLAQFKQHRINPKLVPLSNPLTILVLGVIALCIPSASHMFGESFSAAQHIKSETSGNLLPLPDVTKGPSLRLPSKDPSQDKEPPTTSSDSQGSSTHHQEPGVPDRNSPDDSGIGGGWTTDPRYNN